MEEYEMIEKIRNGTIPFEMALEKYHNFIWKFINEYSIADYDDDDLYSILSMELYQAIQTYNKDKGVGFMSYFGKCMLNKLSLEIASSKRVKSGAETYNNALRLDIQVKETTIPMTYAELVLTCDCTREEINRNEMLQALEESLNTLSDLHKDIVTKFFIKEMTQKEIGEEYGITYVRVKQRINEALPKLQCQLKKRGFTQSIY